MNNSFIQNRFAERIGGRGFGKDGTLYKFEKIKRAKRKAMTERPHVELIDMGVGEPDDMAYPDVVETLAKEAAKWENRMYTDNGIHDFRLAVKAYMKELYDVTLDVDTEICHTIGSKSALAIIPACFINPGDVSIMTVPGYPVMGTWTKYHGGEVVNLPLTKENHFFPDLSLLSEDQRQRAKLLYLNYPNNPTGASAAIESFRTAIDFALTNDVLIVSDAAYAALNFAGNPLSILSVPGASECAIELHSMSKGFNMTGWRLGWVCGHELAVSAFAYVKDNTDSGQFAAIQKAAAAALAKQSTITGAISKKYSRRLGRLTDILKTIGFNAEKPEGSFFLYVEIPQRITNGPTFSTAEEFSQWLIREKSISTVPWDDAGHYIRFSATFVAKTLDEEERILKEIENRLKDVDFVFL